MTIQSMNEYISCRPMPSKRLSFEIFRIMFHFHFKAQWSHFTISWFSFYFLAWPAELALYKLSPTAGSSPIFSSMDLDPSN